MRLETADNNAKVSKTNLAQLARRRATPWSRGHVVNAMLERYFELMALAAEDLWWLFTLAEMALLIEACGRDIPAKAIPNMLYQDVLYNVQEEGRAEFWSVSADSFLAKVDAMTQAEWFALADISSQFFIGENGSLPEALVEAGLRRLVGTGRTCQQ